MEALILNSEMKLSGSAFAWIAETRGQEADAHSSVGGLDANLYDT